MILFISGFHRSGTTMLTSAVTEAVSAATLTTGHLARHLPALDRFLRNAKSRGRQPDRGVDRLPVTDSMPEEYGWLLRHATGQYEFGAEAAASGILDNLVAELVAESGAAVVVLKNPWDTGHEHLLLEHFPAARVLLVRRSLGAIEDSLARVWERYVSSSGYVRALIGDTRLAAELLGTLMNAEKRAESVRLQHRRLRLKAIQLAWSAPRLPADRVAYLSYDELRADPEAGAAWAAHILDPGDLARAVRAHAFPEYNQERRRHWLVRFADWYLARAWRRARNRQLRAGVLAPVGTHGRA